MLDRVRLLEKDIIVTEQDDSSEEVGSWNNVTHVIEISAEAQGEAKVMGFYHELCHAILDLTGVSYLLQAKQEEAVCNAVALGVVSFLQNNKEIPGLCRKE